MSRLRLNQELRNKIASRWRVHAEQEETDEKEKYFRARESIKPEQDKAWDLTHTIVRRHYTNDDVKKARYLQDKFDNVDTIAVIVAFILVIWVKPKNVTRMIILKWLIKEYHITLILELMVA